jgi:ankyrin repeat protein
MNTPLAKVLKEALEADDKAAVEQALATLREALASKSQADCDGWHAILGHVRSVEMAVLLLGSGLKIESVSEWWKSGLGLERLPAAVAEHFCRRGAALSPHAAAALGLVEPLRKMLDRDPALVGAKGGDGCRPLHFSRDVDIASLFLDRGAEIDARDDDHDSTPAQWRIRQAPEVTRLLLRRGARPDLFMAAALNDRELAEQVLQKDPASVTYRMGHNSGPFPGIGYRGRGGTIYQWTLGFNQSAQEIAFHRGHRELFDFLMRRTPPRQQLLIACMLADRKTAEALSSQHPEIVGQLDDEDLSLMAKSCWETNLNREAVRLMLDVGFPVDKPERSHGYTALHNASWCGDAELVDLLLQRGHPVGIRDPGYDATPLGYAIYSCTVARRHPEGDFPKVIDLLLTAGVPVDKHQHHTGDPSLDAVIQRNLTARRTA